MAMIFPVQWSDPFGLVMLEAMACGPPVLALPGGSIAEVIQEEISGHICPPIRELNMRVETLNLSSSPVRQHVGQNFSIDEVVTSYVQLNEEILKNGQATVQAKRERRFGLGQQ